MAKKGKRNIKALIAKRAELQSLNQRPALSIPGSPKTQMAVEATVVSENSEGAFSTDQVSGEIWRTIIATAIIAVVFIIVVVADRQSPFLDTLGANIYEMLRLGR